MKIIFELSKTSEPKLAREIAEELDYSSKLVARRGKNLDEREGLIERKKDSKPFRYKLTEKAIEDYLRK